MKKTKDLTRAIVKVIVYKHNKYIALDDEGVEINYSGVTSLDVIEGGEEAKEIEENGLIDDDHVYLVLHCENGRVATFRSNYIDIFIL